MGDEELAKDLGLVSAMTIGIGTMIGAGIFVLPGEAAQEAGPIVVASFLVGGVIAMVNALSISELGTAMPKAGGGYYYVNRALGPMFGSVAGLGDWMGLAFASAFYSIGFGQYLTTLAPIPGLFFLSDIQIGALIAGAIFVGVNYIGAKETGGIQTVIVFTLLAILGVFAVVGWFSFDYSTLVGSGGWAPMDNGYGAVLPATALVFVSFLGYAKIATVAEEMKNPGRNLPIAIIGSVAIVTVIYGILVTIMLGVVPWPELSLDAPVADAARVAFPGGLAGVAATIMTLGALLATASSANASILSSARINFAMGRDKIVTDWLNDIHPRFATPYRSIAVTGGMILFLIAFLGRDLQILAKAASVLHLIVYALMNMALIVFRETDPVDYDPDFRVPLYPITPIVGTILSLALIGFMAPREIALAVVFVVVAVGWYFIYARGETDHQGYLGQYILDRSDEMPEAAVSAASTVKPDGGEYRVMVPLSNPRTEKDLIELGSLIAKAKGGTVVATHIVQVPDQTPLYAGSDHVDRIDAESQKLLDAAREDAETFGATVETKTVVSHRSFEEVFDAARTDKADLVVMGWGGGDSALSAGRVESPLDELTSDLPCDFLVLKDRGFDLSNVLVPTAGGYSSDLSAEVAEILLDRGSDVSLLYVVDDESEQADGEAFLSEWADERGLDGANRIVDTSGDVEGAIAHHATDRSMVIIGATREGLLSRLVRGSLAFDVLNDVDSSVLLAERPQQRSLVDRLFGR